MCTCDQSNSTAEAYRTFSEFEISTPEEWRTSTRYHDEVEDIPEYITSTSRRIPRRDFPPRNSRVPARTVRHRLDLIAGVAIVPRRIDFDAVSDIRDLDIEGDLGNLTRETLQRLRSAAHRSTYEPESVSPDRLKRSRRTQHPSPMRKHAPKVIKFTPCGKCFLGDEN